MYKYLLIIFFVVVLIGGVLLFGQRTTSDSPSDKLRVTASFYPMYFFASEIGGDKADVYSLTPAGVEPHDYEPSTQDIALIERGDMLVLNGEVEAWADEVRDNLRVSSVKIVVAGEDVLTKEMDAESTMVRDPHVWLSPQLAKQEVEKIAAGYLAVDPKQAAYYQEKTRVLLARLDELDGAYKSGLRSCKSRDMVTSHAAFAYLADAYDLRQIPIAGLSPEEEPSAQQLAKVVEFVKDNDVSYIFFESLVSPKLSETIAHEVGAKTLVLDPLEGLSDDDIDDGKNYFTVMEENLKNLQIALQCS